MAQATPATNGSPTMTEPKNVPIPEPSDPTVIVATTQDFKNQFVSTNPSEVITWANEQDGLVHVSIQPAYHAHG